jgi:hypothetical protein
MIRRLNRGVRRLGGWRFWTGFWIATLAMNVNSAHRQRLDRGRWAEFASSWRRDLEGCGRWRRIR